ncbi:hypothetical protein GJW-30_1_03670 [Variibacter gotjawalensis]|uniref:GDYXXLXY protein n=1 Tax=Variibacter gotjawalensis TaxID=1333996 RepID=A0A0S3PYS8_9BRAD|nr:GDYXXLXY domain-containing protein [Variibacter gotjawalensis]NIK46951.1 putative membrane-anchored protein [Variibacter gotjawalensis]RZS48855.1 putative membrane-anchored protein [Variibacter gotjawalensis]BAT61114.1 hypothetical protein GJW-30_1_03670 [Variibacter gotjawalensis]
MNALMATLRRVPRPLWFALAAIVQAGLVAAMVYDRVSILRTGKDVLLATRAVDPRDFLRGDYVVLAYDVGQLEDRDVPPEIGKRGGTVYVKLAPGENGVYSRVSVHAAPVPVSGQELLLQGKMPSCRYCSTRNISFGLEKYFVPEGQGRDIEHARNDGKVTVIAAVTPSGRAAIKRLLIDGKPVYDEPLF